MTNKPGTADQSAVHPSRFRYLSVCSGIEAASVAWRPPSSFKSLEGHRNGRLVAIEPVGIHKGGHVLWRCACDCGGEAIVQSNNLQRNAGTKSCGCLRREAAAKRRQREGVWNDGKSYAINSGERCYKTRHAWAKAALRQLLRYDPETGDLFWMPRTGKWSSRWNKLPRWEASRLDRRSWLHRRQGF